MLEVSGLTVEYAVTTNTGGEKPVRAVDDVSFNVAAGESVGIVGEPGCGKSTLLFAVAQLLSAPAAITAGSVTFRGQDLVAMTGRRPAAIRLQNLSGRVPSP